MKIVFLARYLPAEGSTTHMYTLANEMIKKGHEVTIISSGPDNKESSKDIFDSSKKDGINHFIVKFPKKNKKGIFGKVSMLFQYFVTYPKVKRYIKKNKINVIHSHYPVTTYIPAIMRFFNKKYKFVVTHHISGIPKHPLNRKGNKVIAIGNELENELLNEYQYEKADIVKIYNGVSEEFYISNYKKEEYKNKIDINNELFTIGFVGTFTHRKGIDVILKAISLLDFDFQMVFLGEGEFLEEELKKHKLEDKVIVRSFSDPKNYYRAFDCFVLPSRQEGFPLVAIEAMLSQTTVIRSDVEGATQQIIDKETGFLFKTENHKQLAQVIKKLYEDESLNNAVAKEGQKNALENFVSSKMAEKTLDVYKEVLINEWV